jgi:hypothetical protein
VGLQGESGLASVVRDEAGQGHVRLTDHAEIDIDDVLGHDAQIAISGATPDPERRASGHPWPMTKAVAACHVRARSRSELRALAVTPGRYRLHAPSSP